VIIPTSPSSTGGVADPTTAQPHDLASIIGQATRTARTWTDDTCNRKGLMDERRRMEQGRSYRGPRHRAGVHVPDRGRPRRGECRF
jgi:hypothetical protein